MQSALRTLKQKGQRSEQLSKSNRTQTMKKRPASRPPTPLSSPMDFESVNNNGGTMECGSSPALGSYTGRKTRAGGTQSSVLFFILHGHAAHARAILQIAPLIRGKRLRLRISAEEARQWRHRSALAAVLAAAGNEATEVVQ